ncbi:PadR family transcriptional regulator [Luteococcus sediminum]|uniref:PadR family transcriptional regulator n=1 Tax=Luteococcus sp. TaxID=1969402 RepID=UPI0037355F21
MEEVPAHWPTPWIRASLELAILSVLTGGDLHGYAIAERLADAGMGRLKGGSLYPVLARLEEAALVEAVWQPGSSGPRRKAYAITPSGREERRRLLEQWNGLTLLLIETLPQGGSS